MHIKNERHFAPVVPLDVARFLRGQNLLGEYHLLLAHDVLRDPEAYREIYAPVNGKPLDIIMDNSLIELGYPMRVREVIEAAHIVGAKKVVLPDVLGDYKQTLEMVQEASCTFDKLPMDVTAGISMVAVVQGNSLRECCNCLVDYRKLHCAISIPRVLVELLGTRRDVIQQAFVLGFTDMHLLGFSDNIVDDVACTRMPGVKGIDSAVPIRAGAKGVCVSLDNPEFSTLVGPRGDFWERNIESYTSYQLNTVRHNLDKFRKWINQ